MKNIRIGLARKKGFTGFFKKPGFFFLIPIAPVVCVSSYVIYVTASGVDLRLASKFFKEYNTIISASYRVTEEAKQDIVIWAKRHTGKLGYTFFREKVFGKYLGILVSKEKYKKIFKIKNEKKVIKINKIIKFLNKQ